MALQEGLFTAQGLHIKYVPTGSSDTVISAQESGTYDVTAGNYLSYIEAVASGQAPGLQIIAEGSRILPGNQAVYTMPGSPITTVPQLKGRRVAINAPGNINYLLVASVLAEYGLSPADVDFVTVPFPGMAQALKSGAVAAAAIPEPFASEDEQSLGLNQLIDTDQGATQGIPIEGYVVTRAWARKYPRTLAAFTRALTRGQQIADTNLKVTQQALAHYLGLSRNVADVMTLDDYPTGVDATQLQRIADLAFEFGLLKKPFSISTMIG